MENANPIFYTFFIIILLTICRCGRLYEIKEKKYSYNQCFLSATNELSLNLNNNFRSSLVQNINLYLLICQSFTEEIRFLISFKIRAHRRFQKILDIQKYERCAKHFVILNRYIFMYSVPEYLDSSLVMAKNIAPYKKW